MNLMCLLKHSWKKATSFGQHKVDVTGFECSKCGKRKLKFKAFAADFITPMQPKVVEASERWRNRLVERKPAIRLVKNDLHNYIE